jgi:hypothetical protein
LLLVSGELCSEALKFEEKPLQAFFGINTNKDERKTP